ncbi:MAG: L,D-transpeptidase family protein [Akkermansiaceae bacterium]|nr:L,D-transpeptidase family protein [Akkermansiaceae bacterium]
MTRRELAGRLLVLWLVLFVGNPAGAAEFRLPPDSGQLVLGVASGWNSSEARLTRYEKRDGTWVQSGPAWRARLGRDGLAWGRGLHPLPKDAAMKKEGDWRAPAGVFRLGGVWGYAPAIRKHPKLFYRQVTPRDLWIEDPASADYNRHVILNHDPATPWEKKQRMKLDDPAHALKLFIAHNAPPKVVPGGGSSIFFHIWRDAGGRPSAGCTTMDAARLRDLIGWLNPDRKPLYVLLPQPEYDRLKPAWGLP